MITFVSKFIIYENDYICQWLLTFVSNTLEVMTKDTSEKIYDTIRQRLVAARKATGMTQEQLAHKTGLDRSHIGYIEQAGKQQRRPTVSTLHKLSDALGISLESLFKGL